MPLAYNNVISTTISFAGSFYIGYFCFRSIKMQLFIRGTQTHVVEVNGTETVNDVKVPFYFWSIL